MSERLKKQWTLLDSSDPPGERARDHVSLHSADKRLIAAQQVSCCSDSEPKGHTVAAQSFMRTAESPVRLLCFFMFNSSLDVWLFVLPLSHRSEITCLWLRFVDHEHLRFHLDFLRVIPRLIPEPEVPPILCKLLESISATICISQISFSTHCYQMDSQYRLIITSTDPLINPRR